MAHFVMMQVCIVFLAQGTGDGVWEVIPGAQMVAGPRGWQGRVFSAVVHPRASAGTGQQGSGHGKAQPRNQAPSWGRLRAGRAVWVN